MLNKKLCLLILFQSNFFVPVNSMETEIPKTNYSQEKTKKINNFRQNLNDLNNLLKETDKTLDQYQAESLEHQKQEELKKSQLNEILKLCKNIENSQNSNFVDLKSTLENQQKKIEEIEKTFKTHQENVCSKTNKKENTSKNKIKNSQNLKFIITSFCFGSFLTTIFFKFFKNKNTKNFD